MVSYQVPKPPLPFLKRVRESIRLASAFVKGDRSTISDITAETWMSPLQPLSPFTPNVVGRGFDYAPGLNIQFQPRGYGSGRVPFKALHQLSRDCELLRLGIETVKDLMCANDWQVGGKEDSGIDPDDPRLAEVQAFLESPDKIHTWEQWLRLVLEESLVTDAVSIYRTKTRGGKPYSFEVIDGQTIKPLVDADGRRPLPPDPAYQQILKGAPRVDYTTDELLYFPRTMFPYDPIYGMSPTEQVIISANTQINRAKYQLVYFTEGSVPDAYAEMPPDMTPDSIRAFEDRFNDLLAGNAAQRRRVPFLPSGSKIEPLKQAPLKDDFDEWLARIICYTLSLAPSAFIKQMNRATAQTDQERTAEEGQSPRMRWIKNMMDILIGDFGYPGIEFQWRENKDQDQKQQADIAAEYLKVGAKTINEVRTDLGLDPVEGGDTPMALTPTGYVPLDSFDQTMQQQKESMNAQAKAKAEAAQGKPGNASNGASSAANQKDAYGRVGKAVRHKAIPLAD